MIIAVDFDGTLAKPDCYPDIGQPNWELIDKLRVCHEAGDTITIWTCRAGEDLEKAVDWLKWFRVPFDRVNENDPGRVKAYGNDCRKIGADVYIDDRAMRPEEWVKQCAC